MIEVKADCKSAKTIVKVDADAKDALLEASAIVNALYRNLYEDAPELAELFRMFVMTSDDCWRKDLGMERVKIQFPR